MPTSAADLVAQARATVTALDVEGSARYLREHPGLLILDVREEAETAEGTLTGATLLPRGLLEFQITEICPETERPILIYCAVGGRAVLAASTLNKMGYTEVVAAEADFAELAETIGAGPRTEGKE